MSQPCRLCGGPTEVKFRRPVLGRYDVGYGQCARCGSLQTDPPTWTEDAYATSLTSSDVGSVQRSLTARAAIWSVRLILGAGRGRLLDFGGGTGLLCRLLRDIGIDAWMTDRYSRAELAQAFRVDAEGLKPESFDTVSAFEVLEHFPDPAKDLARIIALKPRVLLTSTVLYNGACDPDWWYLASDEGQHVFFYTARGLAAWAEGYGYHLLAVKNWQIFVRNRPTLVQRLLLALALRGRVLALTRPVLEMIPTERHLSADHRTSLSNRKIAS